MSNSAAAVAKLKSDIEQTLGLMRTQLAAFRRMASPEVMAAYPRITAIIGREDFLVSHQRSKAGLNELMDEADLLAWDVPHLLEESFTEKWMMACFTANDVYPDSTSYQIHDYLRGKGGPESPFPAYFAENLQRCFYPLGRLLSRSGYPVGPRPRRASQEGDPGPLAYARVAKHFKMHPAMISGAIAFGEQTRRCHEFRQSLRKLEPKLAEEQAHALWDEIEAERNKRG
jgi:hypothetical protein